MSKINPTTETNTAEGVQRLERVEVHYGQTGNPETSLMDAVGSHLQQKNGYDSNVLNPLGRIFDETSIGRTVNEKSRPLLNPKKSCRFGCMNVRTMNRVGSAALVEEEVRRYKLEIAGLSEVRWHGKGKTIIGETTFIYSGVEDGIHEKGVTIALGREATKMLESYNCVNERVVTARLKGKYVNLTVIQVYAPTEASSEEEKDQFYEILNTELQQVYAHDVLLLMGDFNAKVGCDNERVWSGAVGRFGIGARNDNGQRLLELCVMNGLKVTNTFFNHKLNHKTTWTSPDGLTQNLIDYVIVNRKWSQSVLDTRVFRGCRVPSDHKLVIVKMRLKLRAENGNIKRKYDVDKLKCQDIREEYQRKIEERLEEIIDSEEMGLEEQWEVIKMGTTEVAKDVLGYRKKNTKPWISEHSRELSNRQNNIRNTMEECVDRGSREQLRRERGQAIKTLHRSLKNDQNNFWRDKALEIESAGRRGDAYGMFAAVKFVKRCNQAQNRGGNGIKNEDGELKTSGKEKCEVFRNYFQKLYNPEVNVNREILRDLTLAEVEDDQPISMEEITQAMKALKNRKAAGSCGILPEMLKEGGVGMDKSMLQLCNRVWETGEVPEDWKRAIIVPIFKNKGSREDCGNYRGISLLSVPGKLCMRVLLNRIKDQLETKLREEQAGFRRGRSTVDQIFTLRQVIQKKWEYGLPVYVAFVDLEKAYDSVWREGMWRVAEHYGVSKRVLDILKSWYCGVCSCVRLENECSDYFQTRTGLRQGCVMSPTFFNIYMDRMMSKVVEGQYGGVTIGEEKVTDLDFADDVALLADSWMVLALMLERMEEVTQDYGINISTKKTEVMCIRRELEQIRVEDVVMRGEMLKQVEEFTYLGSVFTADGRCIKDIDRRKALAAAAYNTMDRKIRKRREISREIKMRPFNAVVLPILLYGATSWTLTRTEERRLDSFEMKLLRRLEGVRWDDFVRNDEIRDRLKQIPVSLKLRSRRLAAFGHLVRMDNTRIPAKVWRTEMAGRRPVGRPRTRWDDMLKRDLRSIDLDRRRAEEMALDRDDWREAVLASCRWTAAGRQ